ncbi:hypothetical protein [Allomuricauda sp. NBRC 101325]|uniref:hypothetical protein n=1 Tax=Allomuricauda sp. NBRC 101325 TaxID=1113758 RepID=UPI00249FD798|nr:hypothetical protein [Muricauda sp. NBRC 101325]GLU45119.1 hypothetical protein Musp01_27430 [Muricauda sp. NBRC 101325]
MEEINYIKHLNGVFGQFTKDGRLNPTHISLYMALFQLWNYKLFREWFHIDREDAMILAKIGSKSTYHRCIKELAHWGYIYYDPSHNPFKGSRIKMFNFETSDGQVMYLSRAKNGTSLGQAVVRNNKPIQTPKNNENPNKQKKNKRSKNKPFENGDKQGGTVPNGDNLRTSRDKNYNEPL